MPFAPGAFCKNSWNKLTSPFRRYFAKLRRHPVAGTFLLFFIFLPMLAILAFAVILPVLRNPYEEFVEMSSEEEPKTSLESLAPAESTASSDLRKSIINLETTAAFWQARLQLAKSDSIGLVVNLKDSLASLEIKGVPIRVCRIQRYRISSALRRLRGQGRLQSWLAAPFTLQGDLATLPKAPVRVVEAPADTIEAQNRPTSEVSIEKRDVHYSLEFDRDLVIAIEQTQATSFKGWWEKWWYKSRRLLASAREATDSFAHGELPKHRMLIEMELPQEDAKAIYRALPQRAEMVLYF
ncbi:MAG: hypothetical protein ACREOO_27030 [bacterium]